MEPFGLTDLALYNIILGFLAPVVIALIARPAMSPIAKIIIQVMFSIVVGFFTAYFNNALAGRSVVSCILLVLASSALAYKAFWKPTGFADSIEAGVNGGDSDLAEGEEDIPEARDTIPQDAPRL